MNVRIVHALAALGAAFLGGSLLLRHSSEVSAGCSNNPFKSGTFQMTPGSTRDVATIPAAKSFSITSITSSPFLSSSLPSLELFADGTMIGVVPGKCESLGWHFETHLFGTDSQGGFHVAAGQTLSVHLAADSSSIPVRISLSGLLYDCSLSIAASPTMQLSQDSLVQIGQTTATQSLQVRVAVSAPFQIPAEATLQPYIEIYADDNLAGVIPAHCEGRAWTFETAFPFVTGIAIGGGHVVQAVLRNAGPIGGGSVPVSFVTLKFGV